MLTMVIAAVAVLAGVLLVARDRPTYRMRVAVGFAAVAVVLILVAWGAPGFQYSGLILRLGQFGMLGAILGLLTDSFGRLSGRQQPK